MRVNFDLIDLLDSYRSICFYGRGAKVTQHDGIIQYCVVRWIDSTVVNYRVRTYFLEGIQTPAVRVWMNVVYFRYVQNRHFSSLEWAQLLICDCFSIRMWFFHPQGTPHNPSCPGLCCSPCHENQKHFGIHANMLRKQNMDLLFCDSLKQTFQEININLNPGLVRETFLGFPHKAIQPVVLWNGAFQTSRSTTCRNGSNWSYYSFRFFYELFPYSDLFLGGIESVQDSHRIRWNFWFAFLFRETPDIPIIKVEFISYQSITQAWNLVSHRKTCFSDRLHHLDLILLKFWRFPGSSVIGDFSMLKGSPYFSFSVSSDQRKANWKPSMEN